jgi:hypothetical protein
VQRRRRARMPQRVAAFRFACRFECEWHAGGKCVRKLEQPGDISCLELEFDFVNRIAQDQRSSLESPRRRRCTAAPSCCRETSTESCAARS